jgi:hypothetical protein
LFPNYLNKLFILNPSLTLNIKWNDIQCRQLNSNFP